MSEAANIYVEPSVAFPMDVYPLDIPGRQSWGSGLEGIAKYCAAIGVRNAEVHPTRRIVDEVAVCIEQDNTELPRQVIGSVHQTFNTGEGILGRVLDARGVMHVTESLRGMMIISRALDRRVPAVQYMHKNGLRLPPDPIWVTPDYPGAFNIVQPSAELTDEFNLSGDTAELLGTLRRHGHRGLCPDRVWAGARSKDGAKPPDDAAWDEWFASGYTYESQLRLDSFDIAGYDPDMADISTQEFKAFSSRRWQTARDTKAGELVIRGIENWKPPEDLVREVGAAMLRLPIEIPPRPTPGAFLRRRAQHARVVENLAEIIREETRATPLLYGDSDPVV